MSEHEPHTAPDGNGQRKARSAIPVNLAALGSTLERPEGSLLRQWLTVMENPDPDPARGDRWREVGWEVFERKALLLAAAKDLELNGIPHGLKLAATDIFVEKAQRLLTMRGRLLYAFGGFTAVLAIAVMAAAGVFLYKADVAVLLGGTDATRAFLTVLLVKATTAGAFIVGIVYFLVSLSRALLHEGTVLYNRRHSLRFGRLYVYLLSESISLEELEKAFQWNAQYSTAFKDIRAENVAGSPLMKLLSLPSETLKVVIPLVEKVLRDQEHEKAAKEKKKAETGSE